MSTKGQFKASLPVKEMDTNFTLIVDKDLQAEIAYLHAQHKDVEWCGMLHYEIEEGTLADPEKLVVRARKIYVIDVGSAAYTEGEVDAGIIDFYEEFPECENMKVGFIHTHHGMNCFFSGTDKQELHDNTQFYNYYLSLIVNHESSYCAKIACIAEGKESYIKWDDGKKIKMGANNKTMFTFDADIQFDVPESFKDRHAFLKPAPSPTTTYGSSYGSGYGYSSESWGRPSVSVASTSTSSKSEKKELKQYTMFELERLDNDEIFDLFKINVTKQKLDQTLAMIYNGGMRTGFLTKSVILQTIEKFDKMHADNVVAAADKLVDEVYGIIHKEFNVYTVDDAYKAIVMAAIADHLCDLNKDLLLEINSKEDILTPLISEELYKIYMSDVQTTASGW